MKNILDHYKNPSNTRQENSRKTLVSVRIESEVIQELDRQKENRSKAIRQAVREKFKEEVKK